MLGILDIRGRLLETHSLTKSGPLGLLCELADLIHHLHVIVGPGDGGRHGEVDARGRRSMEEVCVWRRRYGKGGMKTGVAWCAEELVQGMGRVVSCGTLCKG